LSPEVVELIPRFLHVMDRYGQDHRGTHTILHGDFRNDNLMFGLDRVVVLDWQTVSLGAALSDVSYFLGGSLLPDLRRQHETGLVQLYWQRLVSLGVEMDWKDCWSGYRRFAFAGLIMAIFASMVVTPTKRGDDMFVAMADRAGLHALDMDALALIPKES
jgi:aminoglycoside phosphotransferase (APT) family kinase protein